MGCCVAFHRLALFTLPQLLNAPHSAFSPSLSHPFFRGSFSSTLQRNPSFQRLTVSLEAKWDVKKISYVPLKNQIRPGNNSERFVFLNHRHSREFLLLVLVFSIRPLGSSSVSAWFDFKYRGLCAGGTFANVTSGSWSRRRTNVRTHSPVGATMTLGTDWEASWNTIQNHLSGKWKESITTPILLGGTCLRAEWAPQKP